MRVVPKILFRVDASHKIGTGHLYECLWFAKTSKFESIFCINDDDSRAKELTESLGFRTYLVKKGTNKEIQILNSIIETENPDILMFDMIAVNSSYLHQIKPLNSKVVILNALLHPVKGDAQVTTVFLPHPKNREHYGTKHILLKPELHSFKARKLTREVKNVLLLFGGGDPGNFTWKSLLALSSVPGNFKVTVVTGYANKNLKIISNYLKTFPKPHKLHYNLTSGQELGKLMLKADIALASGGYTLSELMYLGIPIIALAQNKIESERIYKNFPPNTFVNLGSGEKRKEKKIASTVTKLVNDYPARLKLAGNAAKVVDGKGIERLEKIVSDLVKTKIVILGAGGNLGRILTPALAKDFEVRVVTRNEADITKPADLRKVISKGDIVLNLVGISGNTKDYKTMRKINVSAQKTLLETCKKIGVKRIIFLSSLNIYKPQNKPSSETDPVQASDNYSKTKILAEKIYKDFSRFVPTTILRMASVYGPRTERGVIPSFAENSKSRGKIIIPESPAYRDFIYIEDVIALIKKALEYNDKKFVVLNGASGSRTSLQELAEKMKRKFKKPIEIISTNPPSRPVSTWGGVQSTKRVLNFTTKTSLEKGLDKYLTWYFNK